MIILRVAAKQLGKSPDLIDEIVDQEMSGLGAVNQVRNGNQYSLIITDLSMPIIDGYQVAQQIRQLHRTRCLP